MHQTVQRYNLTIGESLAPPPDGCIGIITKLRIGERFSGQLYLQAAGLRYIVGEATISYTILRPGNSMTVYRTWSRLGISYRLSYVVTNEVSAAGITRLRAQLCTYSIGTRCHRAMFRTKVARAT